MIAAIILLAAPAAGAAPKPSSKPPVLHPRWRDLGQRQFVSSNGRYTVYGNGSRDVLVDEQTGRRTSLSAPCPGPGLVGGGWVLIDCYPKTPRIHLYRIATHAWKAFDPKLAGAPWAIGKEWIMFSESSGPHAWAFHNIKTGAERTLSAWRPGASTVPDLDSPPLARKVCAPLRVPGSWPASGGPEQPGMLTFEPGEVIAQGSTRSGRPQTYIERCGSTKRVRISATRPLVANAHLLLSATSSGPISGVFLPSLRPVRIATPPPPAPSNSYVIDLGLRALYVLVPAPSCTPGGAPCVGAVREELWAATIPRSAPPAKARSVSRSRGGGGHAREMPASAPHQAPAPGVPCSPPTPVSATGVVSVNAEGSPAGRTG